MFRLVLNIKLSLPGLALLARDTFYDDITDEYVSIKYVSEALACLKRVGFSVESLTTLIEELYFGQVSDKSIADIRKLLQEIVKKLKAEYLANQSMIELLQAISGTFTGDNKHYVSLRDNISLLNKPEVTALFPIEITTDVQIASIDFINSFTEEQIAELKEAKDPKYKKILHARKLIRIVTADFIKQYCRARGSLVNYKQLYTAIEKEKLKHSLPRGFEGYIDEFGVLYTRFKKQIEGFPSDCDVEMNSTYTAKDDCYIFSARSSLAKHSTYFYTNEYRQKAKKSKFAIVKKMGIDIDRLRSKWVEKLKITNPQFQEAVILELIYQTQARIGSNSNATLDKRTGVYKKTYGISTIKHKHFVIETDGSISFSYPGKAAFKGDTIHYQQHKLLPIDKPAMQVINWFKKINGCNEDSQVFSVSAVKVRKLLKDLGAPEGATIHKLRTLKGTTMMKEKIKNHPFKTGKTTVSAVNKWLKEEALDVGIQLGHMSGEKYTASTAIAHYIDPVAMLKLYREARVAPPKTILKLVGITQNSMDTVQ